MAPSPQQLIKSFKTGHQAILGSLSEVQLVARSYLQARKKICELEERLFVHWGRQNDIFFKQISDSAGEDRETAKIIEFLIHDLKDVKITYLEFADKYSGSGGDVIGRTFAKDFQKITDTIVTRIQAEEEYLFFVIEGFIDNKE